MGDVTRLFAIVCALLWGRSGGVKPTSGYCIDNLCFTVSKKPGPFTEARSDCKTLGGHLMTVRSSVSQDVLSLVLGNVSGRFWIGLHLPTGCPDQSLELNGFSWVTGGSESDFSNWPTTVESGCSPHRCVSVSPVDDFKWTREPCDTLAAGFLCEFSFDQTCSSLGAGPGETPIYSTPIGLEGKDLLSLPSGSVAVLMPNETKSICFSGQWMPAPWKCDVLEGGCEHKCTLDPEQRPMCYCPRGQTVNRGNNVTCEAGQGDPCASLRCAHDCYKNSGGSYACICRQGFKLAADGRSCVDFNECMDARQCPGDNSRCVNTVGGFQCVCKDGYRNMGGVCVDVNECSSAPCEHNCDNLPGSYKCSCDNGYKEDPEEPHKCKLHCGEERCTAECDPNIKDICYCPDGYILDATDQTKVCIDMDECSFLFCDQKCRNTYGSYVCTCSPGYTLVDDSTCVKTGDEPDPEGSGAPSTFPSITSAPAHPDPTSQPSALTVGWLVGIVLCTVVFITLLIFVAYRVLCGRRKTESADGVKAPEKEAHTLQPLTSDALEEGLRQRERERERERQRKRERGELLDI